MPITIVECVPYFSESPCFEVKVTIADAIKNVNGIFLLDRHSDDDHNRSVITFIGTPSQAKETAFQVIFTASKLTGFREHVCIHPRIGATDVVPFILHLQVPMKYFFEMAHQLGKYVSNKLGIPVYLFEVAANRPDSKNLEIICREEYEGLIIENTTNPVRKPDNNPSILRPAGTCAIGTRDYLISLNVYLNPSEITIAKPISKPIRFSSGGLRNIKAIGILVGGLGQESIKLTNFYETCVERLIELIRREDTGFCVAFHNTEMIGLIPQSTIARAFS